MTIRLATLIRFDTLHVMIASAFAEVVFGAAVEPEPDFEPDPDVEPNPVPTAFGEVVFGAAVEPEPDFEPDPDVVPDTVPTAFAEVVFGAAVKPSLLSCSIVGVKEIGFNTLSKYPLYTIK